MDSFNYIKLIEFHYILEGFDILFQHESDKSSKGQMYQTAEKIYHEIFNSCVRTAVREETRFKLAKKWKDVVMERTSLDVHIFKDVHAEINSSLTEFITRKYIEERYTTSWLQNKPRDAGIAGSILSLDSGFQSETSKNAPFNLDMAALKKEGPSTSEGSIKSGSSKYSQRSKSKSDKTQDKFAALPKELLERQCSSGGDTVLTRHINKNFHAAMMFNEEQAKQAQRNHHHIPPSTCKTLPEVTGHLPNTPSPAPALQALVDKLETLASR